MVSTILRGGDVFDHSVVFKMSAFQRHGLTAVFGDSVRVQAPDDDDVTEDNADSRRN